MGLSAPLLYLCSGVVLNTLSQLITDTKFSRPEAHVIPFVKFAATLAGAALRRPRVATATPEQRRLMLLVGLLDASAYTVYCLGFFACGATLANLLLSGVGQVLTASLTRWVLRRRLTGGQLAGIAFVSLGLAVRAAPAAYFDALPFPGGGAGAAGSAGPAGPSLALSPEQLTGAGMVALAAFLYSLLGVAYEKLLKGTGTPPPNAEIMWNVSILGFLASSAYQALYTVPNWDKLVAAPMAAGGSHPYFVGALLALFGLLFNLHMLVQAAVFKSDGALGVGLVNAVRGAVITIVIAALFCSSDRPHLCLTPQTILSAAVTTLGGAVYVLTGGGKKPPTPAQHANEGKSKAGQAEAAAEEEEEESAAGKAAGDKTAAGRKDKDA
ncbi:transporter permease [Micractinium conductrix]|uniref:Transporter permease n=1 Tax=Micractinium conductrix TaxID=554055 RepID=A0A2P6V657_9CHLO|nr:transporter permease [Micractinium conductrix]|eukprot:PSC69568.1 transporter permease [Micractinium conductrix]